MKLLFDQNISPLLCRTLADLFPQWAHVRDLGLRDAEDVTIWNCATQHQFAIVTKDAAFRQRSFLFGHPPKVVWINLGNCSTRTIEALLRKQADEIKGFLGDEAKSFLSLS